jgi:hypothetical protein
VWRGEVVFQCLLLLPQLAHAHQVGLEQVEGIVVAAATRLGTRRLDHWPRHGAHLFGLRRIEPGFGKHDQHGDLLHRFSNSTLCTAWPK